MTCSADQKQRITFLNDAFRYSLGGASPLVQAGVSAGMKEDAAATGAMNDFVAQLAKMNTPAATPVGTPG